MSGLYPETGWAQGASVTGSVYDTSPSGLGMNPAYLASASASASSSTTTSGTIFPSSPADGDVFIYTADATNGTKWEFLRDSSQATYKWLFLGGPSLAAEVLTLESRSNTAYADLATTLSIIMPSGFTAGEFDVFNVALINPTGAAGLVGYASASIGGSTPSDSYAATLQYANGTNTNAATVPSFMPKQIISGGATVKQQYRCSAASLCNFSNRQMWIVPRKVQA